MMTYDERVEAVIGIAGEIERRLNAIDGRLAALERGEPLASKVVALMCISLPIGLWAAVYFGK